MLSCPFRVLYIQKKTPSALTKLLANHISDGLIGLKDIKHVYVCICALNVKKIVTHHFLRCTFSTG